MIGEEACAAAGAIPPLGLEPTWIIDPIDGTQNFVHACPLSCVSIGFCLNGKPAMGCVYDPYRDELFLGLAGQGAYLNGQRISASGQTQLVSSLVLTDPGYERTSDGVGKMMACYTTMLHRNVQGEAREV